MQNQAAFPHEPHSLEEICRQVRIHPNFANLPPLTKYEFEGAAVMLDGVGARDNRVWCRAWWRHFYQGAAPPR